ncbi:hypothetical protein [Pseudarthrobacter cellobiosi]|nr:hypothetical protein [Pseudarthrobacter sp. HLT1-5]
MAGMSAGNSGEFVGGAIQDGALDHLSRIQVNGVDAGSGRLRDVGR